jgi:ABC-2 type transport system permease protein
MRIARVVTILGKDLRRGPRTSFFLLVIVYPFLLTGIVELVFGGLLDDKPRLGVVDPSGSAAVVALEEQAGLRLTKVTTADELWRQVEAHDLDAGWLLAPGFDAALKGGADKPTLDIRLSGDSLASTRLLVVAAVADAVRVVAGTPSALEVKTTRLGDKPPLPIKDRMLPLLVLLAVMLGGAFLPAFSLVDEREHRTLSALLVSPTTMSDVLVAKGALGFLMAFFCAAVTLVINGALGVASLPLLPTIAVAAVLFVELGIMLGCLSKDANTMMTVWKGTAWFFMLPLVPYFWDEFPLWIAMASPAYYVVTPVWKLSMEGAAFADVAWYLGVAAAFCAALLPAARWAGSRAERRAG